MQHRFSTSSAHHHHHHHGHGILVCVCTVAIGAVSVRTNVSDLAYTLLSVEISFIYSPVYPVARRYHRGTAAEHDHRDACKQQLPCVRHCFRFQSYSDATNSYKARLRFLFLSLFLFTESACVTAACFIFPPSKPHSPPVFLLSDIHDVQVW